MNIISKSKQAEEEKKDEENEEERDKKTLKDREWDDWKDAHCKGIGNRKKY